MLSAQVHLGKIPAVAVGLPLPSTSLRTGSTVTARPPYTPRDGTVNLGGGGWGPGSPGEISNGFA
jgi:hypothetical protein